MRRGLSRGGPTFGSSNALARRSHTTLPKVRWIRETPRKSRWRVFEPFVNIRVSCGPRTARTSSRETIRLDNQNLGVASPFRKARATKVPAKEGERKPTRAKGNVRARSRAPRRARSNQSVETWQRPSKNGTRRWAPTPEIAGCVRPSRDWSRAAPAGQFLGNLVETRDSESRLKDFIDGSIRLSAVSWRLKTHFEKAESDRVRLRYLSRKKTANRSRATS